MGEGKENSRGKEIDVDRDVSIEIKKE